MAQPLPDYASKLMEAEAREVGRSRDADAAPSASFETPRRNNPYLVGLDLGVLSDDDGGKHSWLRRAQRSEDDSHWADYGRFLAAQLESGRGFEGVRSSMSW